MSETMTLEAVSSTGMQALVTTRNCLIENVIALHYVTNLRVPVFSLPGAALNQAMERLIEFHAKYGSVVNSAALDG